MLDLAICIVLLASGVGTSPFNYIPLTDLKREFISGFQQDHASIESIASHFIEIVWQKCKTVPLFSIHDCVSRDAQISWTAGVRQTRSGQPVWWRHRRGVGRTCRSRTSSCRMPRGYSPRTTASEETQGWLYNYTEQFKHSSKSRFEGKQVGLRC